MRRRPIALSMLCLALLLPLAGCGTLLFSERQKQPNSGRLDRNILILDGIGLLFFVVPGLVAFGIDFYTGAIYLPHGIDEGEGPFFRDSSAGQMPQPAPEVDAGG